VRCNGLVRFDAMLELASRLGAARLATGHYARIDCDEAGPLLRAGADDAKDQAYMLARLAPSELDRLWFPLGELDKPSVRGIAREAGLPVAEKPESQDLCFLAGTRAPAFLTRHGGAEPGGQILDLEGNVVGEHGGQRRFTVGQRRGIGVAAREPLYVVAKDPSARTVTVGPRQALATREVSVADAILYRDAAEVDRVKLRYRSAPAACKVSVSAPGRIELRLEEPVLGVAPGQTACLMRGDQVIGWGTIALQRERAVPLPIAHRELMHAR
jgi:tRNA-specific 2-thiouridylase